MKIYRAFVAVFLVTELVVAEQGGPPVARWTFDEVKQKVISDVSGNGSDARVVSRVEVDY